MNSESISIFDVVKKRLAWLNRRQEVLADNIANADTPGFKPRDLEKPDFRALVSREVRHVNMARTANSHLGGRRQASGAFAEREIENPYETAPNGNAVVLEEQMAKVSETQISHKLTTELYRKHLSLMMIALGRGGR